MYSALLVLVLLISPSLLLATESESADRVPTIRGVVYDKTDIPLASATIQIGGTTIGITTDSEGRFILRNLAHKVYKINIGFVGYATQAHTVNLTSGSVAQLSFTLLPDENLLSIVEVFGERYKQPKKLDAITRVPLRPSEQIQSISVISEKSITEQGVLTVAGVTKDVPGVTPFGSYGGVRESMSIRGYRRVPTLKDGVRIDSDFRTGSALSEMQEVGNIQVIRGSATITQGIGNDLGNAGGVINVITKTPKFTNEGEISLQAGSWGLFRSTFGVQSVLDKNQTITPRMNGAFERSDNYRPVIHSNRMYINPSLERHPDDKTSIIIEMDYLNGDRTSYTSSVNLSKDTEKNLCDMPHNRFLGFKDDSVDNKTLTYTAHITRQLTDNIGVRAAYFSSSYKVDSASTSVKTVVNKEYNVRRRTISRSLRDDRSSISQLGFVGRGIFTGPVKHTFQLGFDYKNTDLSITNCTPVNINTINILAPSISNVLSITAKFVPETPVRSNSSSYGIMTQEVVTFNKYIKAILGLGYSYISSQDDTSAGPTAGDAWNPMLGIMLTPIKNINLFGSYTTTTSLLHVARRMESGDEISPSNARQFEVSIRSDWLNNRLHFNLAYFDILTRNLSHSTYHLGATQPTGYFDKAGSLERKGIETELSGSILESLQVMMGYAYLDTKYENSPVFRNGSVPMNTPKHIANGWIQYRFDKGVLKRLLADIGAYFVGKRPVNDFAIKPDGHGSMTSEKLFDVPGYATINAQLAYSIHKFIVRIYLNSLFGALGYNSYYRGGCVNQINPRNLLAIISYRF